jgi:hypothetical protein
LLVITKNKASTVLEDAIIINIRTRPTRQTLTNGRLKGDGEDILSPIDGSNCLIYDEISKKSYNTIFQDR